MSGRHARIFSSIWQDEDFRRLSRDHQRLYLFLLSQANVTHLGVLPLTLKRWAKSCAEYTVDALQDDLAALAAGRYIVVDEDSEELLIRSLLRRDGVYKQPNVLLSAINSADGIDSAEIKRVLVAEVDRIDVDAEIKDDSKGSAEGKRKAAREGLATLRGKLADPAGNPSPNPSENPSRGVGRTHNVRATRAAPSPTPTPSPSESAPPTLDGNRLLAAHCEALREPLPRAQKQKLGQSIDELLAEGISPDRVKAGLAVMRTKPHMGPSLLPAAVAEADQSRIPAHLVDLPSHERFVDAMDYRTVSG